VRVALSGKKRDEQDADLVQMARLFISLP